LFSSLNEIELFHFKEHSLSLGQIITAFIIFILAKILAFVLRFLFVGLGKITKRQKNHGQPMYQLSLYVLWVVAVVYILEALGFEITVILAGSAALLVGLGLGLQQTFNDILSGLVLLFERSVRENDILEIDGEVVKIQKIGFRYSLGLTRDKISVVIPNSAVTTSKVINWTMQAENTRFHIDVPVAYGSDVEEVIRVLEQCARENKEVSQDQMIEAWLVSFGDSAFNFRLFFCSNNIFTIERTKSDLRRAVNAAFKEHQISIPFNQLDVHLKHQNS